MIKLTRATKPEFLSDSKVKDLTQQFHLSGDSVWNIDQIKNPLLTSSNKKCAYCECSLTIESNYMEVEHFQDKKTYPEKVVDWDNLLPSCKKCNGAKGTHDVIAEPIVNPFLENPKDHLSFSLYRLRGKTLKGEITIEVTDLNNSARNVMSRFLIGEKIHTLVEKAYDNLKLYKINQSTRTKNKIYSGIEGLLIECQETSVYSASTATILLNNSKFLEIISDLVINHMLPSEIASLLTNAEKLAFDKI